MHAVGLRRRPHRVEVPRVVGLGRRRRQEDGPEAAGGDPLDLGHRVVDVGERNGGGGDQTREVRREPLDDVVVVHAGVGDGQLVVVGVEAEERQVRMHDPDVDAVDVEVLEDHLGVALGHPAARLAVAGDRPPLEPGRVQSPEDPGPALDQRLDLEVVLPDPPVPQVLGQAGGEEVGGLEDVPVGGDDELVLCHGCDLPAPGRKISMTGRARTRYPAPRSVDQPVGTGNADERVAECCDQKEKMTVTKRWKQRPSGSTWGDWGEDDELGRINLLTPEKVLEGVREVEAGISFCLSLPLDYPRRDGPEPTPLPAGPGPDRGHAGRSRHLLQRPHEPDGGAGGTPSTWTCGRTTW